METRQNTDRKFNAIDAAKLICAILVVTIHEKPFGKPASHTLRYYMNYGICNYLARIAVPFFFVTSGFLLYRKLTAKDLGTERIKQYLKRLLRLYLIWSAIYLPLSIREFAKNELDWKKSCIIYVRDFIFKGSYGQLWYLPALIFAVLLVSFLLIKKVSPKAILSISACFYVIGLLFQSWYGLIYPLKSVMPWLWKVFRVVSFVVPTTRNGLFDAFFFVSLGMCFAFCDIQISPRKAAAFFALSMIALFAEVALLRHFEMIRHNDMYLFLMPATYFLFCFLKDVKLPDSPVYGTLRMMSSIIFFTHMLFIDLVIFILKTLFHWEHGNIRSFIAIVVIMLAYSYGIAKLSERQRFRWLKQLF